MGIEPMLKMTCDQEGCDSWLSCASADVPRFCEIARRYGWWIAPHRTIALCPEHVQTANTVEFPAPREEQP
jgi:hypothetical protein